MAEDAAGAEYVRLEELLPENLEEWKAAALRHAIGQHDMLIRRDALSLAFSVLCGSRYCAASDQCANGVPSGVKYVVCMNEAHAEQLLSQRIPEVIPLLTFQLFITPEDSYAYEEIVPCLLYRFKALTAVDFSGVRNVKALGPNFLVLLCEWHRRTGVYE